MGDIQAASSRLENAPAEEVVAWGLERFGDRVALSTSFQAAGMVLLDISARLNHRLRVFTLDTGRLPQQTYDLMAAVQQRYGIQIEVLMPETQEVESMVTHHGADLFYEGVAKRMLCCEIRKVRPLARKLKTLDAWMSGLRRGWNEARAGIRKIEIDREHDSIVKLSPLADWSTEQVEDYIRQHDVPRHALYAEGYTSIGCQPCTRPIQPGEHPRAGRWWWESDAEKECGIHFTPSGKAQREVDFLLEELIGVQQLSS